MATPEQLLHEAQYAFLSISAGETRQNKRNAARARSLSRKIIRNHPASMEAKEALAILRRLGDEAYESAMGSRHRHITEEEHHRSLPPDPQPQPFTSVDGNTEALNWRGLIAWLFELPKAVLWLVAITGFFLFAFFGPLLIFALIVIALLTGPLKHMLRPRQRGEVDAFIRRVNALAAKREGSWGSRPEDR